MSNFSNNLKILRKELELTQTQLADKLGLNRATLASYEEGRAEPKFESLQKIASFFKVSLDDILQKKIKKKDDLKQWEQKALQVLPIVVDKDDQERITLVSRKATAGYLTGFQDAEFIEQLPSFHLPFDKVSQGTFRAFEIEGDSMLPIPSGSIIIAQYEDDWRAVKEGAPYIVVSENDGLTYKRIELDLITEVITLTPDNKGYESYSLPLYEIRELWKAVGFVSFDLDLRKSEGQDLDQLSTMFLQLKKEVEKLKSSQKS